MFRHIQAARPIPLLIRVFLLYFAFFFLRVPFYEALPRPTPPSTDMGTVYLQLPFILMISHFSDNWKYITLH